MVEAEHLLKACLLADAPPELLDSLSPAAAVCGASVTGEIRGSSRSWDAFSLALYHHRRGDAGKVLAAVDAGLEDTNIKDACAVSLRALAAIARHRRGERDLAAADFQHASAAFRKRMGDDAHDGVYPSRWYDWSIASTVMKEAAAAVAKDRAR